MDTLIRHRPRLQLEIQPTHIAKYGACAHDVVNLLVDLGHDARMAGRRMAARRPGHRRRNYLFVDAAHRNSPVLLTEIPQ